MRVGSWDFGSLMTATCRQHAYPPVGNTVVAFFCLAASILRGLSGDLEATFKAPPEEARPWVHWQWIDGNISREGITADLEAMRRVGIRGAIIMDATSSVPAGPVPFWTSEWRDALYHALAEASRLGLELGLHVSPGYTGLGGPWVTVEDSMQKLVWASTNLSGPGRLESLLPALPTYQGTNWAMAVLAFPSVLGDGARLPGADPTISTSVRGATGLRDLLDDSLSSKAVLPLTSGQRELWLQFEYPQPYTANRLRLISTGKQEFAGTLRVSDNGRKFKDVREFRSGDGSETEMQFQETRARYFRLQFRELSVGAQQLEFTDADLAQVHEIPKFQAKSGLARRGELQPIPKAPPQALIPLEGILDLTGQVDASGTLRWDVPPGRWTVLRLGRMPVGRTIPSARLTAQKLEADRLNSEAVERHFNAYLMPFIAADKTNANRALTLVHVDSWESGFQNWTPDFAAEFKKKRGYAPLPWLPAFTGRIVSSPEETERFLWDVRRTIADMFADRFAGELVRLSHQHGLKVSIQSYFNGPFDDLQYGARADIPSAEFWNETDEDAKYRWSKYMSSIAHTHGRRVISAEAFSSWPVNARWQNYPGQMKFLADRALCEGVNQIIFHCFTHQPWLQYEPGMTFGFWGVHYERTQTWWELTTAWHDYLARCQALLREGLYVADLLYLTPEGAYTEPPGRAQLTPPPPDGYHYDVVHAEVLSRVTVAGGELRLPDGMSYRALILPPERTMRPELLRQVAKLVQAGATIVGPPPLKSPSLSGYPAGDQEVAALASKLWGQCDGLKVTENRTGAGRVVWGKTPAQVLTELGVPPDFQEHARERAPLRWIHRQQGETDFYFLANAAPKPTNVVCSFRVAGRIPELWDPERGTMIKPAAWDVNETQTTLPIHFDQHGSVFVVFRQPIGTFDRLAKSSVHALQTRFIDEGRVVLDAVTDGTYRVTNEVGRAYSATVTGLPKRQMVAGPWDVEFAKKPNTPGTVRLAELVSWPEHPDSAVKHFSGTALYRKTVALPETFLGSHRRIFLDLGRVEVVAKVRLNGRDFPPVWKAPFVVEVTGAARAGENHLEVAVANLWVNRMIGDEYLPEDVEWKPWPEGQIETGMVGWPDWFVKGLPRPSGRTTFATWKFYKRTTPLFPSGLVGPVTFSAAEELRLGAEGS